jgi:hypothetical protein
VPAARDAGTVLHGSGVPSGFVFGIGSNWYPMVGSPPEEEIVCGPAPRIVAVSRCSAAQFGATSGPSSAGPPAPDGQVER